MPATLNSIAPKPGEPILASWTAPVDRATDSWIGLYTEDGVLIAKKPLGSGTSGEMNFGVTLDRYELRMFIDESAGHRRLKVVPSR